MSEAVLTASNAAIGGESCSMRLTAHGAMTVGYGLDWSDNLVLHSAAKATTGQFSAIHGRFHNPGSMGGTGAFRQSEQSIAITGMT